MIVKKLERRVFLIALLSLELLFVHLVFIFDVKDFFGVFFVHFFHLFHDLCWQIDIVPPRFITLILVLTRIKYAIYGVGTLDIAWFGDSFLEKMRLL